jgi:hypothetical protein
LLHFLPPCIGATELILELVGLWRDQTGAALGLEQSTGQLVSRTSDSACLAFYMSVVKNSKFLVEDRLTKGANGETGEGNLFHYVINL